MSAAKLPEDFYERIKPRLHRRVGRTIRLARRVLDLGCGSCELVRYLAESYGQEVTGLDILAEPLPKRRRAVKGVRFRCLHGDARNLDFAADASVDAVVVFWALHEMAHPDAILGETRRVLRPGGTIVVVEFPKVSLASRLWDEKYYSPGEVEALLMRSQFEEVKVRLIERKQIIWACAAQPARAA